MSLAHDPHTTPVTPAKPGLHHWTDAWDGSADFARAFRQHVNPGLFRILQQLGYHSIHLASASDVHYVTADGRRILDCWGGFGSLNVGHNHPRLAAVRRAFDEQQRPELAHAFVPAQAALLAANLAMLMPGDLDVSYLCCTGSEAVEAALKLAQKAKGSPDGRILYAHDAMHGKTHGALSVTGSERLRAPFRTLLGCEEFPFGDAYALRTVLESKRGQVVAIILEPVQSGGGVVVPPRGYLQDVRRLCDEHGAVMIVDEIQTGLGRTGKLFAFQHDDIVPDIVLLSKALGGGKAPVGACVARRGLHAAAYGSTQDCTLHNATFGEMGGSAAMAIETLHILFDEGLVENAATTGDYLAQRLEDLQARHPELVVDVRGSGLLAGVEIRNLTELLPGASLAAYAPRLVELGDGPLAVLIAAELLHEHDVLVAFTDFNRNVLRIEPPLTIRPEHVDRLVDGLDEVLSAGVLQLIRRALGRRFFEAGRK